MRGNVRLRSNIEILVETGYLLDRRRGGVYFGTEGVDEPNGHLYQYVVESHHGD